MNSLSFKPDARPRLLSPWRLRNDGRNVVVYKCSIDSARHKVLSPGEVVIMPFLNGNNTVRDIYHYWHYILNTNADGSRVPDESLAGMLESWLKDGMIAAQGEPSPSFEKDPEHFIPDFKTYEYSPLRLERPLNVSVALTNRCRTNCRYCYAERYQCKETDNNVWYSLFSELAENEIHIVDISGGDPLSRPDCMELLKDMTDKGFNFFLSTKCHISESTARTFYELGIGRNDVLPHLGRPLQISVDSADPDVASLMSGCKNYLERVVSSVKNAVAASLSPRIKCVLTSLNADSVEGMVRLFSELGITDFQFVQYGRSYYRHDDSLFLKPEQKQGLVETEARLREEYPGLSLSVQTDTSTGPPRKMDMQRWHSRAICSGGRVGMKIQPNGDVTLCDQLPHRSEFVVGNVFKQGLLGVWNSPLMEGFLNAGRERFHGTVCYECKEFDWCHYKTGYCYRDSLFHFGTMYDAPPECPYQIKEGLRAI